MNNTEKTKTFEQMLKAYKEIRKQIMDAKLDDIICVEMSEYNDQLRNRNWINISIHFGKDDEFVRDKTTLVCIKNDRDRFEKGMEDFKAALAERINQHNN